MEQKDFPNSFIRIDFFYYNINNLVKMKATFITILKGSQFTSILVREDKKVLMNFGDENFFEFETLNKVKGLSDNKKYKQWIESKKFKKDWAETMKVINTNDYEGIIQKFIKDFKTDRGNRIIRNDVEIDPNKKMEDIQYEYKR